MWMCYVKINTEYEQKTFEQNLRVIQIPPLRNQIVKNVEQKLTFKNFVRYLKDENSFGFKIKFGGE